MKKVKGLHKKEALRLEEERLKKETERIQKELEERYLLFEDFVKDDVPVEFKKSFIKEFFKQYKYLFDEEIGRMSDSILLRAIGVVRDGIGDKFRKAEINFKKFESFIDQLSDESAISFLLAFFRPVYIELSDGSIIMEGNSHILNKNIIEKLESVLLIIKKKKAE